MVKRDNETREYLGIQCDRCETMAPPAVEVMKNHGLIRMGWRCSGGEHLCPECNPDKVAQ